MARIDPETDDLLVEPLACGDLVAFAQCVALDVTEFPHPSIPEFDALRGMPAMWIARRGHRGAVAGFVVARSSGAVLEILGLAVTPGQRRRGVGRALIRAAVEGARLRRCVGVALQVSTTNRAAIALYVAEGFKPVKKMLGYYARWRFGDGGNAWVMALLLRPRSSG